MKAFGDSAEWANYPGTGYLCPPSSLIDSMSLYLV